MCLLNHMNVPRYFVAIFSVHICLLGISLQKGTDLSLSNVYPNRLVFFVMNEDDDNL